MFPSCTLFWILWSEPASSKILVSFLLFIAAAIWRAVSPFCQQKYTLKVAIIHKTSAIWTVALISTYTVSWPVFFDLTSVFHKSKLAFNFRYKVCLSNWWKFNHLPKIKDLCIWLSLLFVKIGQCGWLYFHL